MFGPSLQKRLFASRGNSHAHIHAFACNARTCFRAGHRQSIGGTYTVAGTNFDGSKYGGEATITLTSDTTCTIHWETGGSSSDGICMRNDNAFSPAM